ncbi:MAG: hypothetical protein ACO3EP_04190 [Phycisphaerales bacterium]|jgi:hypothetical protein
MIRDPREAQQRLQNLRTILRTMERAVDDAKVRRTAPIVPDAQHPSNEQVSSRILHDPDRAPFSPLGRGRDIPGPESLPRAKAKPKSFGGFGEQRSPFGRTG